VTNENKSILIIDDDARNIFALSLVLRGRGYAVLSASSAGSGIELLRTNNNISLMLLDMMMPDMDGYQALALIRNDGALKDFPVVAVTAQAMRGDREKCLQAGATDYISKPIDVDKLQAILIQHLQEQTG
jgi:two-component system cell cycle response regulator DivK